MINIVIDVFLVSLMAMLAVLILRTSKLFAAIVMAGAYSLISAAMFVNLDAVDVAFTEAAVGAGISTVLMLAAMARLPAEEEPAAEANLLWGSVVPFLICVIAGGLLIIAVTALPPFGAVDAPAHLHVAPRYIEESASVLNIPNVVTSVLASYRGFDTLGETIVIFTAGLGVLLLLSNKTPRRKKSAKMKKSKKGNRS
jgi:multicomponent Na+:H+ antiporter subunit B